MRVDITIRVSESGNRYGAPEVTKAITIDVPGSDFESLNLPSYIQATLETSISEFKQLPRKVEATDDEEIPF